MSAQERNDAVVQANTKQLEVPEYSRKQIANIVEPIVDEKIGDIDFPAGGSFSSEDFKEDIVTEL